MTDPVKKVRLDISQTTWELIEEVARVSMTTPKAIVHAHFMEVIDALAKGNTTAKLSVAWSKAWDSLDSKSVNARLQADSASIDFSVLCTSRTTNSGFEGVYAHSNPARGFIAQGRDPETRKPGKHLGLFSSAAQAAWARYQHYKKHNMPYGKLEEEVEKVRGDYNLRNFGTKALPERWLKAMAIWNLGQKHIILPDLTTKERVWETNFPANDQNYGED
jgi:hypothetical protein